MSSISAAGTNGKRIVTCGGTPLDGFAVAVRSSHCPTAVAACGTATTSALRRLIATLYIYICNA